MIVELQLCQFYKPLISSGGLLVSIISMQQQSPGTMNCGPLSIAAAYHTACGDDVGVLTLLKLRCTHTPYGVIFSLKRGVM